MGGAGGIPSPLRERVAPRVSEGSGEGYISAPIPLFRPSAKADGHPLPQGERAAARTVKRYDL